jgi:hypothetical protein
VWVNIAVLIFAFVSLVLSWKYISERLIIIAQLKGVASSKDVWAKLKLSDKLRFFNLWMVLTIVGNLCQMLGSVTAFLDYNMLDTDHQVVLGFGCWCAWVNLVPYLESKTDTSYALVHALQRSIGNLLWYFMGILPIYMGFVFLGMTIFWSSGYFQDVVSSMATTYAFLNGDTVYDIFRAIQGERYFFGLLYSFLFILFFLCCVQNLTIAFIQEGYNSLKTDPIQHEFQLDDDADTSSASFGLELADIKESEMSSDLESSNSLRSATGGGKARRAQRKLEARVEETLVEIAMVAGKDTSLVVAARIQAFVLQDFPDILQYYRSELN